VIRQVEGVLAADVRNFAEDIEANRFSVATPFTAWSGTGGPVGRFNVLLNQVF
jgi:hypothetical protein